MTTFDDIPITLERIGAALLRGFLDSARMRRLRLSLQSVALPRAREQVGQVVQRADMKVLPFDPIRSSRALTDAHDEIQRFLAASLATTRGRWGATELTLMRYRDEEDQISPHRDHVRYRTAIAILSLTGKARFDVLADRAATRALASFVCRPGDLVLMRAPVPGGIDDRPFHAVRNLGPTSRTSLTFRMQG